MRKLKLQMQMTVDGYVAGPNGELDWMTGAWDDALQQYVWGITDSVDCILLGRKMADGFIKHWSGVAADPANPEVEAGKIFTDTHKVVFSKTLERSEWPNTDLAKGDITEEVNKLKAKPGDDIIVYGGAGFVSSLLKHRLIDDLYLFVNPVAIGEGMTIFEELANKQDFELIESRGFDCGIVLLHYRLKA